MSGTGKKINIVGAGPGGLFLAILLRQHRPEWDVQVWERNPPHATFGFGVVFSDRTVELLDKADPISLQRIRSDFQSWTDIEVGTWHGVRRTGGHGFSAIARHRLLAILQQRARELEVPVQYECEALDLPSLYAESDLLVGADGINSLVREHWADEFQPDIRLGKARFIWFATPRRYDALTFHFVKTPHGPFSTHAYPFSEELSTFIVEVDVDTWRRAGLDPADRPALGMGETDETTKSFCEEIFKDSLQGEPLVGNASQWRQFPTVRNASWRAAGKVVILGDAAHTAHFSVGSGTKMAMEDSAALADVLMQRDDPVAALLEYETNRKPAVAKIQQLAEPSRGWWENFQDWVDRDVDAVSMNFLTRTGRETVEHLAKRDPEFASKAVAEFAMECPVALGAGITMGNRRGIHLPKDEGERQKLLAVASSLDDGPAMVVLRAPTADEVSSVRSSFADACPVIAAELAGSHGADVGADLVVVREVQHAGERPFVVLLTTPASIDDNDGWDNFLDQGRTAESAGAIAVAMEAPASDIDRRSLIAHAGVILRPHVSIPLGVWDCGSDQEALTHVNADRADFALGWSSVGFFPAIHDRLGLECLLDPASVLVVGASKSPEKAGYALMSNLAGFPGEVVGLSRSVGDVHGRPIVADIADVGQQIDLAILAVPNTAVPAALENLGKHGVRAAIVCSGGFAETGSEEGRCLQAEIDKVRRRHGLRVLGPNTSGMSLPPRQLHASFVPAVTRLRSGSVAVLAQSGGVAHATALALNAEGIGVGTMIGTGNATDVDLPELITTIAQRAEHSVIAVHLEGTNNGRDLTAAIAKTSPEVPVVVLKSGVSDVDRLSASHTGALTGDWSVAQSLLSEAGAVVVQSLGDLVDSVSALSLARLDSVDRPAASGVVTGQAGPGILLTDRLQTLGVAVPPLTDSVAETLEGLLPALTHRQNPVDTGRPGVNFDEVIAAVGTDPGIDAIAVYVLLEPGAVDLVPILVGAARQTEVPLVASTNGIPDEIAEVRDQLRAQGIPLYVNPERAARGVWALFEDRRAAQLLDQGEDSSLSPAITLTAVAPSNEAQAKGVLADLGVHVPQSRVCSSRQEAQSAFEALVGESGAVVVKVHSDYVGHKDAVGGVHLGVRVPEDLVRALDRIDSIVRPDSGYLVEEQIQPGVDLFVSVRRDPSWGPVGLIGLGGGDVESQGHVQIFALPTTERGLRRRLVELDPRLEDEAAGVLRILEVLHAAVDAWPQADSFEINPLRATGSGLVALDALVDCG